MKLTWLKRLEFIIVGAIVRRWLPLLATRTFIRWARYNTKYLDAYIAEEKRRGNRSP
jgi:hypothetical protein